MAHIRKRLWAIFSVLQIPEFLVLGLTLLTRHVIYTFPFATPDYAEFHMNLAALAAKGLHHL